MLQDTAARCRQFCREASVDTVIHCSMLECTATYCSTLQHKATRCNALQRTATHYSTLQHTATTLQHSATTQKRTRTHTNTHTHIHTNSLSHTHTQAARSRNAEQSALVVLLQKEARELKSRLEYSGAERERNMMLLSCENGELRECLVRYTIFKPCNTLQHIATHGNIR